MAINKMFIMLPLIFASRKLDAEDKDTIFYLRALYFPLHAIMLLVMIYIYMTASKFAQTEAGKKVIFVPPAAQPFADPNEKGKKIQTDRARCSRPGHRQEPLDQHPVQHVLYVRSAFL
mmetsp:Transcript_10153/g.15127  ORF Transcript_10153/g.15127 Transcript_10153/m.15127 type:complete len:118 (-) Transcript_10153:830-1183(-)